MYEVRLYKGDYRPRQLAANEDECKAYVEQHFNSFGDPAVGYSLVIVGSNASATSKNWGRWYAQAVGREFGVPVRGDDGIIVGGFDGRGDFNLRFTDMPAILLEPLFASNPQHAEWIRGEEGQTRLARILCESIERFFPTRKGETTLIAFSVGHKYKTSRPDDRGASVVGGGTEADFAERVLEKAKSMLETVEAPQTERRIRVVVDGEEKWSTTVDPDAETRWNPERGLLQVQS